MSNKLAVTSHGFSGTGLLEALYRSPDQAEIRILLLNFITWYQPINEDVHEINAADMYKQRMFDALGLGLRIGPKFFIDLKTIVDEEFDRDRIGDTALLLDQSHSIIRNAAITISRDYMPKGMANVPVVVIAG